MINAFRQGVALSICVFLFPIVVMATTDRTGNAVIVIQKKALKSVDLLNNFTHDPEIICS